MSVDVKGLVYIKEEEDPFRIMDVAVRAIGEFYRERLLDAIKKDRGGEDSSFIFTTPLALSNEEDRKKFSSPDVSYNIGGTFFINLSFASDLSLDGIENRDIVVRPNSNDNINHGMYLGNENVEELSAYKQELSISLGLGESAPEIIKHVLSKFGDDHPSYLVRNDCADSFNEKNKNVVKIGKHAVNISEVAISEKEYEPIRNAEIEELKSENLAKRNKKALAEKENAKVEKPKRRTPRP